MMIIITHFFLKGSQRPQGAGAKSSLRNLYVDLQSEEFLITSTNKMGIFINMCAYSNYHNKYSC